MASLLPAPTLQIQGTTVQQVESLGAALIEQHAKELGAEGLNVNWQALKALERADCLIVLGLWWGTRLVGYCVSCLTPDMLHAERTLCQNIATFLQPEHRTSVVAKLVFDSMELVAAARGADVMLWSAPPGSAIDTLMRHRDDTEPLETVFARKL